MKIDFTLKDTEFGWMKRIDRVYLAVIPKWFEWLGWILILGALQYFQKQSNSTFLAVLLLLSYISLWRYFIAVFDSLHFTGTPFLKSHRWEVVFSSVVSGLLAFGFYRIAIFLAKLAGDLTK